MTEQEKQEKFREEVRAGLAKEDTMLLELDKRVRDLERTVTQGNGHPALIVQVKELETKMDDLGKEVSTLRVDMSNIDYTCRSLNNSFVELKTQISMLSVGRSKWVDFLVASSTALIAAAGTAIFSRIFV